MSRYASLDDLKSTIPQVRISSTSRPSEDEAQAILDSVEDELNVQLANLGYTVPITGPSSKRMVKYMVLQETASRVIIEQLAGVRDPNELGAGVMHKQYQDRLDALIDPDNPYSLIDANNGGNLQEKVNVVSGFEGSVDRDFGDPRITRTKVF